MTDYKQLGYDDFLNTSDNQIPFTGIQNLSFFEGIDSEQMITSGKIQSQNGQFYIDFDNNHIELDSIRWDKGYGGTLTLGGFNNKAGEFLLKDSSGNPRITMNNDGITIIDSNGNTVIDENGITSANFLNSETANATLLQSITSTSETDVTGSSMTVDLSTVASSTNVLFLYNIHNYLVESAGNTCGLSVTLNIGGTNYTQILRHSGGDNLEKNSDYFLTNMNSGTHTVKLKAALVNVTGSPSATIYSFSLTYITLGR